MAITDKTQGVWNTDEVYNKINQSDWPLPGSVGDPYKMFKWGSNHKGQLGLNTASGPTHGRSSPTQVPGTNWASIGSSPSAYSDGVKIATKSDGTLWMWGNNVYGALGQNTGPFTDRSSPVQVPGTTWKDVNGSTQVMATKTDGTLWMWGINEAGKLGQNQAPATLNGYSSPVQIPGTTWDIGSCKSGINGIVATIKTDGTLWVWGSYGIGGHGLNDNSNRSSPTQIPGTWSTIAAGSGFTYGVKTDGTAWGWGRNEYGEMGQNTTGGGPGPSNYGFSSPIQIGTNTNWFTLTAGQGSCFGTKTDGTLWSWGANKWGNLAQNSTSEYARLSSPTQIGSGTDWSQTLGTVATMEYAAAAMKTDGTLWAWGYQWRGVLGNNTQSEYAGLASPVQLPGTSWARIFGTANSVVALQDL